MKAVIGNRIFLETDIDTKRVLNKALTYKLPGNKPGSPELTVRTIKLLKSNIVSIPSGRYDLIPEGYEVVDKRTSIPTTFPEFKFRLRDSQQEIYDDIDGDAIINAFPSFGKTFTALAISAKLGEKTLVVLHTVALRKQWEDEIKKVFGITPGVIGSGKFDISPPIVVANIQTLNKHIDKLNKSFGLLILDECLDYETLVTTDIGQVKIGKIVNQKLNLNVLSFNETTKSFEWKPIIRHFKNPQLDPMVKFSLANGSTLKCTMNHTVYSLNKGKVPAEELIEGDYIITNKSFKSSNLLSDKAKPIILGMILGDGSLSTNGKSCRLRITHGEAQHDYLKYKTSLLDGAFVNDTTIEGKSGYKPTNSTVSKSSLSFYDIDNWRDDLYGESGNKHRITKDIASILTKESWAIMYMDDGSISNKHISFSLCDMDDDSIDILIDSLNSIFRIYSYRYTCSNGYNYIKIPSKDSKKFLEQISELIHPIFDYKFGDYGRLKEFVPAQPVKAFEDFTALKIVDIDFENATNGYRYNIEVADNHNYLANHKLVSNCHHCPAKTFTTVIDSFWSRYKLGLSGTLKRKDGRHVLFQDYFGSKVYQPPKENCMEPTVHIYPLDIPLPDTSEPWASRVNAVLYNEEYIRAVSLMAAAYASQGHKVLVVSDRTEFSKSCVEITGDKAVSFTGEIKNLDERSTILESVASGDKDILYGTMSLFSEGISVNALSCVILATPLNNESLLTQIGGRVIREQEGKLDPIIVDINLSGKTAARQAKARIKTYLDVGWNYEFR